MAEVIRLSDITQTLIKAIQSIKHKARPDDFTKLTVSQTVTFLALVYEKIRNAIEYREDHLIRRAAIERILKRRLGMNPKADGEGENLLRELMWARYFPNGTLDEHDIHRVQVIIDRYITNRTAILASKTHKEKAFLSQFLFDLLTCEIEEKLNPEISAQEANFTYYIYQTLKDKVKIEQLSEAQKDAFLFIAIEKAYRRSDLPYQRYHLFNLFYQPLAEYSETEIATLQSTLPQIFHKIEQMIANPTTEKLVKFTRKQLPPFLVLFELIRQKVQLAQSILQNPDTLWAEVNTICQTKYQQTKVRLNILAFRSLIYIFVTKMIFALILEVPISRILFGEIHFLSIAVNSIAPALLMLLIVLTIRLPGEDNTKKIYQRIIDIVNADQTFEKTVAYITKTTKEPRPILKIGFTVIYFLTFVVTLYLINLGLSQLNFNILSKVLFIFFISVVSFFSYRIKNVANEYRLIEKESILRPVTDFFMMPILSLGKIFSSGLSSLNVFILVFDFIIEAPFKLIIEVIEEWIKFVRARKEEII